MALLPYKKNIDLTVKIDFFLTYQIKNMKLTLSIQSCCKNHVIQADYQKIDFIEKLALVIAESPSICPVGMWDKYSHAQHSWICLDWI